MTTALDSIDDPQEWGASTGMEVLTRAVQTHPQGPRVETNPGRNSLLTDSGCHALTDRYIMPGESFQDVFARVAVAYSDSSAHARRMYDAISRLWFMPSTPVLSNGGTERGLPISCYLNEASDSLEGIMGLWNENVWLAARGGGIGSYWGHLRSLGEKVGDVGKTSGIIPFIKVMDSLTLAISQGSLRRGSAAVYLPIDHPEIEEFIDIRRPSGGDPNRRALNLHHGVVVSDAFMRAVDSDSGWALRSPRDKEKVVSTVSARGLWIRLLTARVELGEPYILFYDAVNRARPEAHKTLGLEVRTSNLCSEITLPTGPDHLGGERTAVCCLGSVNLARFDDWSREEGFIEDCLRFLDNVLQDFIERAPDSMARAKYAAMRERSVGLGAMGFHSALQAKMVPFESATARSWNRKWFTRIHDDAARASLTLGRERGPCPDASDAGLKTRFTNATAIAPTASISVICGGVSPGIEPYAAAAFTHKTLSGSRPARNPALQALMEERGIDSEAAWRAVARDGGSARSLGFLDDHEKMTFRTAFEMDQRWIIDHAADRAPLIDQSQSVNLFLPANIHKRDLHLLHRRAWAKGLKSLYYCRSMSLQRSEGEGAPMAPATPMMSAEDDDECLACQ